VDDTPDALGVQFVCVLCAQNRTSGPSAVERVYKVGDKRQVAPGSKYLPHALLHSAATSGTTVPVRYRAVVAGCRLMLLLLLLAIANCL